MMNKEPRGIRNKNPGNIKYNGINWAGLAIPPSDGVFCVFTEHKYGLRALGKLLRNYNRYYGIRTINGIIKRFAPATENQTDAYIKSVAASTGYDPHLQLNLESNAVLVKLMKAIIKHENGKQPYTDEEIEAALQC